MSVLSNPDILRALQQGEIFLDPWTPDQVGPASISLHLGDTAATLDIRSPITADRPESYPALSALELDSEGYFVLERNTVLLMPTFEQIGLPRDLAGWLSGTSDLARIGVGVALSQYVAPGFGSSRPGALTLELTSNTAATVRLLPRMRVAHLILVRTSSVPGAGYDDLEGNYSGSKSVKPSFLFGRIANSP